MARAGTSVSSSAFPRFRELLEVRVAPQALCNLARVVPERHRLDEICVPLEVSLSTRFTTLHFLLMCFNIDLPSWRPVLELFLREDVSHCKALLLRTFLGFDLRLVRLVLVSVFRSLLVLPVNFRLVRLSHSRCSFRFSSVVFLAIRCTKVTTRPTGFTRLRLCVGVVLTLVTSVFSEVSFISVAIDISTNVLCLLDATVRHIK